MTRSLGIFLKIFFFIKNSTCILSSGSIEGPSLIAAISPFGISREFDEPVAILLREKQFSEMISKHLQAPAFCMVWAKLTHK